MFIVRWTPRHGVFNFWASRHKHGRRFQRIWGTGSISNRATVRRTKPAAGGAALGLPEPVAAAGGDW